MDGVEGIYNRYQAFGDQVRDLAVEWGGRGRLPRWAVGAEGEGFPTLREARAYWARFHDSAATEFFI